MFQFQYPVWFWALLVLPGLSILFWGVLRWKEKVKQRIGDPVLVNGLIRGYSARRFRWSHWLMLLAIGSLVFGLAHLRKPDGAHPVNRKGVDVMIALDVSKSMLAQDLAPNRMAKAKQLVSRLIDKLPDDRVGLVLFAGRAYMQMPLTTDHSAAQLYVNSAGPNMVPTQGTVIAEALRLSNAAFNPKEKKYKAIVLITDGEDHDPEAVEMAKKLAEMGVMICTVGVGSTEGSRIPDEGGGDWKRDAAGNVVVSALNDKLLREIASAAGGEYVELVSTDTAVKGLQARIGSMEQRAVEDNTQSTYASYFIGFAIAAFLFLVAELLLNTVFVLKPRNA